MSAKTKKIDREFILSDSSVNVYGFRLLTKGYLIDEYKRNPIGYYMHNREEGVIVKWEDLRVVDDKVMGKPVINLSNEKGQQIVDEIENGFLNAASVGHIVAIEWSEDPKMMEKGQTGPTITKWYNRECSLCDVPGNSNALALFDKDGNEIKLTDFKIQNNNMKQIILTAEQLTKLNLKADSEAAAVDTVINDLVAAKTKVEDLTAQLTAANTAKTTAETEKTTAVTELNNLKATTTKEKVKAIGDKALADKKMTVELRAKFDKKFENDPEGYQDLVDSMKPYEPVTEKLTTGVGSDDPVVKALMAKTGEDLWKSGELDKLRSLNAECYKIKYKEAFGDEPAKETEE